MATVRLELVHRCDQADPKIVRPLVIACELVEHLQRDPARLVVRCVEVHQLTAQTIVVGSRLVHGVPACHAEQVGDRLGDARKHVASVHLATEPHSSGSQALPRIPRYATCSGAWKREVPFSSSMPARH